MSSPTPHSPHRRRALTALLAAGAAASVPLLLGGCSRGPVRRLFPPSASVQELRREADGSWSLQLRVQNFSTAPVRFDVLEAELEIGGSIAGRLSLALNDTLPPTSAETFSARLQPAAEAAARIEAALADRRGVGYRLSGRIRSSEPARLDDAFDFTSVLTPMPGLDGVLR